MNESASEERSPPHFDPRTLGWTDADRAWFSALIPPLQDTAAKLGRPTFEFLMATGQANECVAVLARQPATAEVKRTLSLLAQALNSLALSLRRTLPQGEIELAQQRAELTKTLNLLNAFGAAPAQASKIILPN